MTRDRFERVADLFDEAKKLGGGERADFLQTQCGDDAALRNEVERLIGKAEEQEGLDATQELRGAAPGREHARATHIGPYRILHECGRGGMGVVYAATRDSDQFQRRVALKVLKRGTETADVLRRFELERQVLAAMNHPGIAQLYDGGETEDGLPYFVMEYVSGLPIDEYCDANRLVIDDRLDLFRKVCAAVHHAHQNLVVHRDLKPSNIIVTSEGEPKLLDFGIAKLVNPGMMPQVDDPTAPGIRIMTPAYASPEQVRGHPVSTATDVYSLGVLLYELVCGHRPYRFRSRLESEVQRIICEEDPQRPSTALTDVEELDELDDTGTRRTITPQDVSRSRGGRPDRLRRRLAGDIDNIVLMAMRKEPPRRYKSAGQFAEDIQRHREGMPVVARPDTYGYRVSKFVTRNRAGVAAAALIGVLLVGGIVTTTTQWRRAEAASVAALSARAEEQRQREIAEAALAQSERRFEQVRAFGRAFFGIHNLIRRLEGALPATEYLVTTALQYLEGLRTEAGDDAGLLSEIADGYHLVGEVMGGARGQSFGDTSEALDAFRQAETLRRALVARTPGDIEVQQKLQTTLSQIGDMQKRTGDLAGAVESAREAESIAEAIVMLSPDEPAAKRGFAKALLSTGDVLLRSGDSDEALTRFERSLAIRRDIASANPDSLGRRRDVTVAIGRVASVRLERGERDRAFELYREYVDTREELAALAPDHNSLRRDVTNAHWQYGLILLEYADEAGAERELRGALRSARRGVVLNPQDSRSTEDLVRLLDSLGELSAMMERWDDAESFYREAVETIAPLADANPESTYLASLLAASSEGLAIAMTESGDVVGGTLYAQRAMDVRRRIVAVDEESAEERRGLASAVATLGRLRLEAGATDEARSLLTEARTISAALVATQPADLSLGRDIGTVLRDLATVHDHVGDLGQAVTTAEEALRRLAGDTSPAAKALRQEIEEDLSSYRRR